MSFSESVSLSFNSAARSRHGPLCSLTIPKDEIPSNSEALAAVLLKMYRDLEATERQYDNPDRTTPDR